VTGVKCNKCTRQEERLLRTEDRSASRRLRHAAASRRVTRSWRCHNDAISKLLRKQDRQMAAGVPIRVISARGYRRDNARESRRRTHEFGANMVDAMVIIHAAQSPPPLPPRRVAERGSLRALHGDPRREALLGRRLRRCCFPPPSLSLSLRSFFSSPLDANRDRTTILFFTTPPPR